MNDKNSMSPEDTVLAASAGTIDATQEVMDKFLDTARVETVYGQPVQHNGTLIIPTAEVLTGLAFGVGFGGSSGGGGEEGGDEEDKESGETGAASAGAVKGGTGAGVGGGGGGRILSRPVAVIIADESGVRVEPVFDRTKVALAALTAAGFVFGTLARMRRMGRRG